MTRIELATHIVASIRKERNAPVARYAYILAAASAGEAGASAAEIAAKVLESGSYDIASGLSKMVGQGFLRRVAGTQPFRYTPTPAGLKQVAHLLNPAPVAANG